MQKELHGRLVISSSSHETRRVRSRRCPDEEKFFPLPHAERSFILDKPIQGSNNKNRRLRDERALFEKETEAIIRERAHHEQTVKNAKRLYVMLKPRREPPHSRKGKSAKLITWSGLRWSHGWRSTHMWHVVKLRGSQQWTVVIAKK